MSPEDNLPESDADHDTDGHVNDIPSHRKGLAFLWKSHGQPNRI
jgi:hypothetical protein